MSDLVDLIGQVLCGVYVLSSFVAAVFWLVAKVLGYDD